MEKLLEYKKLIRLENKVKTQLAEASDNDKKELEAQLQDIAELMVKLEKESETVQQFIREHNKAEDKDDTDTSKRLTEEADSVGTVPQVTTSHQTTPSKQIVQKNNNNSFDSKAFINLLCILLVIALAMGVIGFYAHLKAKQEKAIQEKVKQERELYFSPEQMEKRRIADSITRAEKHRTDSIISAGRIEKLSHTIKITECRLSSPNSAGGCDLYLAFTNKSDKTIKYLRFECHMINAVGDMVECEARQRYSFGGKYTGPLKPGRNSGSRYWDCLIYNHSAKKVILDKIEIIYMDGSEFTIHGNEIKYVE